MYVTACTRSSSGITIAVTVLGSLSSHWICFMLHALCFIPRKLQYVFSQATRKQCAPIVLSVYPVPYTERKAPVPMVIHMYLT